MLPDLHIEGIPCDCRTQAYLVAGLFEETVKYLAVRRVAFKDYVVDPRALIVYSCCAGTWRKHPSYGLVQKGVLMRSFVCWLMRRCGLRHGGR